jgi:hypothetical protein
MTIQNPILNFPITREGVMSEEFFQWALEVTDAINAGQATLGTGSPEGVVVATPGKLYSDTSAGAGGGLYVKETGDGNTGWILRS